LNYSAHCPAGAENIEDHALDKWFALIEPGVNHVNDLRRLRTLSRQLSLAIEISELVSLPVRIFNSQVQSTA